MSELCQPAPAQDTGTDSGTEPLTQSPKISLNLSSFKATFANQPCSTYGNKSSVRKVSNSGPTQKTLQSFLKGTHSPGGASVTQQTKCSPAGRSTLARFRFGSSVGDTDAEEESRGDVTNDSALELSSSEPDLQEEVLGETTSSSRSSSLPEGAEAEVEAEERPFDQDPSVTPHAKRARVESVHSNPLDTSSLAVDSPVCLQKRTMPLQFSLQDLAGKMKRLQAQRAHRAEEALCYRRFKAKINPGENQSAEAELKKEIR